MRGFTRPLVRWRARASFSLSAVDPSRPQAEIAFLYLGLFLWSLAVDGHIYRHALSATLGLGVLLAVLIFLVNFLVLRALFG